MMADMADLAPIIRTLETELVDVRGQLSTALGDLYERGEELTRARNQIAHRDQTITELRAELADLREARDELASLVWLLAGERDRARNTAVALEQETAECDCLHPDTIAFSSEDEPMTGRNLAGELDRAFVEPGGLDRILAEEAEQQDADDAAHADLEAMRAAGLSPLSERLVEVGRQELADRTEPTAYVTFVEAGGYEDPHTREATEEYAREVVTNEWNRRGLTLGGLLGKWERRPLVDRPDGWTFTLRGQAAEVDWPDIVRTRTHITMDEVHPPERPVPAYQVAYLADVDARRPAVVPGQWVRILERPTGLPAGQIGKVLPPGFTPPSTPASRVIAVKTGPGHPVDAVAWETIDPPAGTREHREGDTDG